MTSRVVVLTSSYPLDRKETFLIDELPFLKNNFKELVVFPIDKQGVATATSDLRVIQLKETKFNSSIKLLNAFGDRMFRREVLFLLNRGRAHFFQRFKTLAVSWQKSEAILNELRTLSRDEVPTVYYAYWGMEAAIALARLKIENPQVVAVSRFHGWDVYENAHAIKYLPFRNLLSEKLDYFFPISKHAGQLINEVWRPRGVVETRYLGTFNTDHRRNPSPSKSDVPMILSISNFNDVKRLPLFVEVFSHFKKPVRWIHIGGGSSKETVEARAQAIIPAHVGFEFLGEKDHLEVLEFLNTVPVTCLLNLSKSEGVPVSMMEAQSRGIPVFGTRVGGVPEIINEDTGVLVDPDSSSQAIAIALEGFIQKCIETDIREASYKNWVRNFDGTNNFQVFSNRLQGCLHGKKPSLLLVTSGFPFNNEDEFFVHEIYEAFSRFEKVVVVATDSPEKVIQYELPNNVIALNATKSMRFRPLFLMYLFFFGSFWKECIRILRKRNVPVGIALKTLLRSYFRSRSLFFFVRSNVKTDRNWIAYSLWTDDSAVALGMLKQRNKINYFVTRLNGWDLFVDRSESNYLPFRNYINTWASGLFCSSKAGKKYFDHHYPDNADKCHVCYLGVPNQQNDPQNIPVNNAGKILVSCSGIVPIKRIDLIVDALAKSNLENIHWVHFGDGPERSKIEEKLRTLQSSIQVTLQGYRSNTEILEFYKSLNSRPIFIHLSESEGGVPVAIQEAMSFGLPVIAAKAGGCDEIVIANETGWLLEKYPSPETIAAVLEEAFSMDEIEYQKMGASCRQLQQEQFQAKVNGSLTMDKLLVVSEPRKPN